MSFRYVDRIYKIDSDELEALKLITRQEPYWVWFDGRKYINPSVFVESFVQALIWDKAYESDFSKINLVRSIEEINFYQKLSFSDKIHLKIQKKDFSSSFIKEDIVEDRTKSLVNVLDIKGVSLEEKDLDEYFYRSKMISLFKNLYRSDLREDEYVKQCVFRYKELPYNINHVSYEFIDGIYEMRGSYIKGFKNFSASEKFLEESKNKIVPVSIILMTAMEFCCFLKKQDINCSRKQDLELLSIKDLKIKNHLRQGHTGIFTVETVDEKAMSVEVKDSGNNEFFSAKFLFR